ncbi:SUN domain-containing protein 2 isoform X1 [Latimeria chalumnae]|uniref:SUN domain-containing protein 2 isoform X1 n=1 Tax=Latimeria chalumnae TaxID=7897 RepID=UPI0003C19F08|nr:PREDICTED: SUN domain-containing protein 2 isoform X1 [Latimeria chalumnae]|eukprot:XP_006010448.1 PREDICTED: SUN domain-containing protein 2 isoform X1 [Latimeria chalumnae]
MSRRSRRLQPYYSADDDGTSTSSMGSTSGNVISYKETPVKIFKRKSSSKRSSPVRRTPPPPRAKGSISNESFSSLFSNVSDSSTLPLQSDQRTGGDYYWVRQSAGKQRNGSQPNRSNGFLPSEATSPSYDSYCASSGYSSAEEEYAGSDCTGYDTSPVGQMKGFLAQIGYCLQMLFLNPGQAFLLFYWWLGTSWYRLTATVAAHNVFILGRNAVFLTRVLLLLLLLSLLLLGIWLWYPSALPWTQKHLSEPQVQPNKQHHTERSILDKVAALEQSVRQLSLELKQQKEEGCSRIEKAEGGARLSREDAISAVEEFLNKRHQAMKEELMRDGETYTQQKLSNYHQKHHKEFADALATLMQKSEDLQTKMSQLSSKAKSQFSAEEREKLLLTVVNLEERLDSMKAEMNGVQAKQHELMLQLDSFPNSIQSIRDDVDSRMSAAIRQLLQDAMGEGAVVNSLATSFVLQEDLQRILQELEGSLRREVSTQGSSFRADVVGETLEAAGITEVSMEVVSRIVDRALRLYSEDRIGKVDYALESAGASVISTRCSETFETKTALLSLFGIPLWYHSQSPRVVLQPDVYPGNCWAFRGSQGFLVIHLASRIRPTAFTLEHIPKSVSPGGTITSAPRDFAVFGLEDESEEHGISLGQFMYDQDLQPIQTFNIEGEHFRSYQVVELRIFSNWGHPEYTCIYRFRVHGEPAK